MQKRIALVACLLVFSADVSAQSFLEKLNDGLKKANNVLSGTTAQPAAQSGPAMPAPTEAQMQTLAAQIVAPSKPAEVIAMAQEASKVIGEVILSSSCYPGHDIGRYLGRYAAPGAHSGMFLSPMSNMQYHARSQCLTVERLDDWKAAAKNAFGFRAVYVSDQSGESKQLHYQFVRQPDGAWLLRRAGF